MTSRENETMCGMLKVRQIFSNKLMKLKKRRRYKQASQKLYFIVFNVLATSGESGI